MTKDQFQLLEANISNYQQLLVAENIKLSVGESSIFLVNSRERKYLDSKYKKVQLSQKLVKNQLSYLRYSATLAENP